MPGPNPAVPASAARAQYGDSGHVYWHAQTGSPLPTLLIYDLPPTALTIPVQLYWARASLVGTVRQQAYLPLLRIYRPKTTISLSYEMTDLIFCPILTYSLDVIMLCEQ